MSIAALPFSVNTVVVRFFSSSPRGPALLEVTPLRPSPPPPRIHVLYVWYIHIYWIGPLNCGSVGACIVAARHDSSHWGNDTPVSMAENSPLFPFHSGHNQVRCFYCFLKRGNHALTPALTSKCSGQYIFTTVNRVRPGISTNYIVNISLKLIQIRRSLSTSLVTLIVLHA